MEGKLRQPDWYTKPPDQWPDAAREFYRLCWIISRRAQNPVADEPLPAESKSKQNRPAH